MASTLKAAKNLAAPLHLDMAITGEHEQRQAAIVGPPTRILGFDVARAFAILGMMLVHFGYVMSTTGWQDSDLGTIMWLLDGRAAATFMILAGIGVTLRTRSAAASDLAHAIDDVRSGLIRRGLFLLLAGMLLLVVWPGDILRVYGISMLAAACFITAPPALLWTAMAGFIGGFVVLFLAFDYGRDVDWDTLTYHNLWTPSGAYRNLFYDGFRSVFPWTAFVFFGMWLGRRELQKAEYAKRLVAVGLAVSIATELVSRRLVNYSSAHAAEYGIDKETVEALFGTGSIPPLPIFLLEAGSTAFAVIGGSLLLSRWYGQQLWLRALAATGRMAFTWYIAHILGLGAVGLLGLSGQWPLSVGLVTGLGFFIAAAAFSLFYKRRFRQGPLEWLMRTVAG